MTASRHRVFRSRAYQRAPIVILSQRAGEARRPRKLSQTPDRRRIAEIHGWADLPKPSADKRATDYHQIANQIVCVDRASDPEAVDLLVLFLCASSSWSSTN
jgi:hypothetical protein